MNWSKDTPSEAGIYIYREVYVDPLGERSWYQFERLLHVFSIQGVLRADHGAETYAIDIMLLDGWWYGPIPSAPQIDSSD